MEVTFVWSWFSFWVGAAALFLVGFWGILFIAFSQYRKQKKAAAKQWDNVDAMFQAWGGRDNSGTKK